LFETWLRDISATHGVSYCQYIHSLIEYVSSSYRAVVPANVDIATQEIIQMAEDADPNGQRTLGVLTKPDLVDQGAEEKVDSYLII
jgi:hypothetical protein